MVRPFQLLYRKHGSTSYICVLLGVSLNGSSLRSEKTSHLRTISGLNNEDLTAFQPFYFAKLQVCGESFQFFPLLISDS
jgi:hypothetical protein